MAIVVNNVYKVFGPDPEKGLRRLRDGDSREDLRKDGYTAGAGLTRITKEEAIPTYGL